MFLVIPLRLTNKRLCEKCVINLKVKIEAQASFADKTQIDKEIQELSRWLTLSASLRLPKRKDGRSGSDTSSSSSSADEFSSEDEKSKRFPPDCKICHKAFGMFKKSVPLFFFFFFSFNSRYIYIIVSVALLPLSHVCVRVL